MRIPSLKFVGLAVRKIWRTMCVSIIGPGDRDFTPFKLKTGMRVASKVGNLPSKFGHARPLGYRIIGFVCDGQTSDGRTKAVLFRSNQQSRETVVGTSASITVSSVTTLNSTF